MNFRVGGQDISLDHETVLANLKDKTPPAGDGRNKHFVMVARRKWPAKAALAQATGLNSLSFPTSEAVRVLIRCGFPVEKEG